MILVLPRWRIWPKFLVFGNGKIGEADPCICLDITCIMFFFLKGVYAFFILTVGVDHNFDNIKRKKFFSVYVVFSFSLSRLV